MRLTSLILLLIISITLLPGLIYLASIFINEPSLTLQSKNIAPYVGFIGVVITMSKYVYDWSRHSALKFDKHPYVEQIDFISGNNSIIKKRYFVKVKVKKGSGTESCESTIDIKAKDKSIHHRGLWDTGEILYL